MALLFAAGALVLGVATPPQNKYWRDPKQEGMQQQAVQPEQQAKPAEPVPYYGTDRFGRTILKKYEETPRDEGAQAATCRKVLFNVTIQGPAMGRETGAFNMTLHDDWAPLGVDRLAEMVVGGFFRGMRFHRVIKGNVAQFGIYGNKSDPMYSRWHDKMYDKMEDDPVGHPNTRGTVAFAAEGAKTRTTQLFINIADHSSKDDTGFASPVAEIDEKGMKVVDRLYSGYGEAAWPLGGNGPDPKRIMNEGNDYLARDFAWLSFINWAKCVA